MKVSDFLFVREGICLFCKEEETYGDVLCADCARQLEAHGGTYAFDEWHSCSIAYFYNRFLQQKFRDFKFMEQAELAEPMGALLARFVKATDLLDYTHIVPVPMHPRAEKKRGYNQVRLLADELSRHTGIPVYEGLKKTRHTKEQNKLDRIGREKNLKGAFQIVSGAELSGARLLLLDDLTTTGATMKHAADALEKAKPEVLHGLAFCAPRFYEPFALQKPAVLW